MNPAFITRISAICIAVLALHVSVMAEINLVKIRYGAVNDEAIEQLKLQGNCAFDGRKRDDRSLGAL